jgi:hypothetical protein
MRMLTLTKGALAVVAWLGACVAAAETLIVTFPELADPPSFDAQNPFSKVVLPVGTVTFTIPRGQRIIAANITGVWGSTTNDRNGTAGVDVLVDGILIQQCVKPEVCWQDTNGLQPWSRLFKESELHVLDDGTATMTAVQTSERTVRLGASTLFIETAPVQTVPTLATIGLFSLIAGLAATGAFLLRRASRA